MSQPLSSGSGDADGAELALPRIAADPIAALRPCVVEAELAGRLFLVPAMDQLGWLALLWDDNLSLDTVFPMLCGPAATDWVDLGVEDGSVDPEDVLNVALEIIGAVSGHDWWFTLRLVAAVKAAWGRLGGELILHGLMAPGQGLAAWVDGVFALCLRLVSPRKVGDFVRELTTPPPGYATFDEAAESDAFLAAMRQAM